MLKLLFCFSVTAALPLIGTGSFPIVGSRPFKYTESRSTSEASATASARLLTVIRPHRYFLLSQPARTDRKAAAGRSRGGRRRRGGPAARRCGLGGAAGWSGRGRARAGGEPARALGAAQGTAGSGAPGQAHRAASREPLTRGRAEWCRGSVFRGAELGREQPRARNRGRAQAVEPPPSPAKRRRSEWSPSRGWRPRVRGCAYSRASCHPRGCAGAGGRWAVARVQRAQLAQPRRGGQRTGRQRLGGTAAAAQQGDHGGGTGAALVLTRALAAETDLHNLTDHHVSGAD